MTQAFIQNTPDEPVFVQIVGAGGTGGTASADRELVLSTYVCKAAFLGASIADIITSVQIIDLSGTPTTEGTIWRNQTTSTNLLTVPPAASLELVGAHALTDAQLRAVPLNVNVQNFTGLTDAELRATPLDVSVSNPGLTNTQLRASALPVSLASTPGLTDDELRATPVPVSFADQNTLTDAELRATPVDVAVSNPGVTDAEMRAAPIEVAVTNQVGLTNAQLRATPLLAEISNLDGLTDTQLRAAPVPVSFPPQGGLTDTELRAAPLTVAVNNQTGLTNAQLRADAVNVLVDNNPTSPTNTSFYQVRFKVLTGFDSNIIGDVVGMTQLVNLVDGTVTGTQRWYNERLDTTISVPGDMSFLQEIGASGGASGGGITDTELRATPVDVAFDPGLLGDSGAGAPTVVGTGVVGWLRKVTDTIIDGVGDKADSMAGSFVGSFSLVALAKAVLANLSLAIGFRDSDSSFSTVPGYIANNNKSSSVLNGTGSVNGTINSGAPNVLYTLSGTFRGTVQAEISYDGTAWIPVASAFGLGVGGQTFELFPMVLVDPATTLVVPTFGAYRSRLTCTAFTSGSLTVTYVPTFDDSFKKVQATMPDLVVTGAASIAPLNTNLLSGTVSGWFDVSNFRSASIQLIGSVGITGGAITFEGTNDPVLAATGAVAPYAEPIGTSSAFSVAAVAIAANTQRVFVLPVNTRYMRVRVSTAFAGATVRAIARFSQTPYATLLTAVTSGGAALSVTAAQGGRGAIGAGWYTSPDNTLVADVASATILTSATTAALTPTTPGAASSVFVAVTAVAGTLSTLDVTLQESDDTGVNWVDVYQFPRITAVGFYRSPILSLQGNRVRYVQTVGGSGGNSFTRSIQRSLRTFETGAPLRQIFDRAMAVTVAGSLASAALQMGRSRNVQMVVNMVVGGTAPVVQLEGSDDYGANWYNVGGTLTAAVGSTTSLTVLNVHSHLIRAKTTTGGTGSTLGYVLIKAFD